MTSRWSTLMSSQLEGNRTEILERMIMILILSEIILILVKLA